MADENGRKGTQQLERARLRQATRTVSSGGTLSRTDLVRIEAEDILRSRVFSDTEHDNPDGVRDTEDSRAGDPGDDDAAGTSSAGGPESQAAAPG